MIAAVYITIMFHYQCITAGWIKNTNTGVFSNIIGQSGIENLNIIPCNIISYPFVENRDQKPSVILCPDCPWCYFSFAVYRSPPFSDLFHFGCMKSFQLPEEIA